MKRVWWGLAAVVLIAACAKKDETVAIGEVRTAWAAAWKTGNATQLAELYEQDGANMVNNTSTMQGRTAIASEYGGQFAQVTPNDIVLTPEKTEVIGDMAYDRGTFQVSVTPKDGTAPTSDNGRYLVVLKRQTDKTWKIVEAMDNSVTPLPQPTQQAPPPAPSTTHQ